MDISAIHIAAEKARMDKDQIAQLAGFDAGTVPEPYSNIIEDEMDLMLDYSDMKGGIRISDSVDIQPKRGVFLFEDMEFKAGKQVLKYLKRSERLALYLFTAGEAVSNRISTLMQSGNMLEGYFADLIGSLLVENGMDVLHEQLAMEMKQEEHEITNRYSPGCWSWDVHEQHKLFGFFPPGFCGIRLSESGMMTPVKSVSGVIGIGRHVEFHPFLCHECNSVQCIYRYRKHHRKSKFTCY